MRLCQKCTDGIKSFLNDSCYSDVQGIMELAESDPNYKIVPESECEFWAHVAYLGANAQYEKAQVAYDAIIGRAKK